MTKGLKLGLICILFSQLWISCKEEEPIPVGEFAKGVLVVNEGNFTDGDGSLSFYHTSTGEAEQKVYEKVNTTPLGGLIQSVYTYEGKTYVIDNVGARIEVLEAETLKSLGTISDGLTSPRYMTVANGKGYVTDWGNAWGDPYVAPSVSVIDLESMSVISNIAVNAGAEEIVVSAEMVYVSCRFSNVVAVIDPATDTISENIETPAGPQSLMVDNEGDIWSLTNNTIYDASWNVIGGEYNLVEIDITSNVISKTISLSESSSGMDYNTAKDIIYVLNNSGVYEISQTTTSFPTEALISAPYMYGIGYNSTDDMIYLANTNAFQGNGTIVRYNSTSGVEVDNFSSGRGPNGFEFR